MITHKVREEVIKLGSLVIYYLWESPNINIPFVKNYYWHDKTCSQSIGPFASTETAMRDYAEVKKEQKALQRNKFVQELQKTEIEEVKSGIKSN